MNFDWMSISGFIEWNTLSGLIQIIFADIILSGDNALVIGMAAAGLPASQRKRAIAFGMALAAGLRIVFAIIATILLNIPGILLIGGFLLFWVCWRFYHDLRAFNDPQNLDFVDKTKPDKTTFARAMFTILLADISMSIDNVVAVAAIARDNTSMLVFGLALAIAIMAFCASIVMKIMVRYRWLSYLGLVFLIYLAGHMVFDGIMDLGQINFSDLGWLNS